MTGYNCPLCKQTVSKALYEKITGIWREKEERLAKLREQQKELKERAKSLLADFEKKKASLQQSFNERTRRSLAKQGAAYEARLKQQQAVLKSQMAKIQRDYGRKLAQESNRILAGAKAEQRRREREWKAEIRRTSAAAADRANAKLRDQRDRVERRERILRDKNLKMVTQYRSLQDKYAGDIEKREAKIKSLEEQVTKNQTAQRLGLLEEGVLLRELKQEFPTDKFEHTGKGGDIVHHVFDGIKEAGVIVYELKKVAHFSMAHVQQANHAKKMREADYALLVTNAKKAKEASGFFVSCGVIVIYPSATLVLVGILRSNLISISRLKLSAIERKMAIRQVIDYVQGPSFRNSVDGILQCAMELYDDMTKEYDRHKKTWQFRYGKYREIWGSAKSIQTKTSELCGHRENKRVFPPPQVVSVEALPLLTLDR